jgi:MrcB-like, N-terminal domain
VHAAVVGRIELRSSASSETVCVRTSTSRVERFALIRQSRSHDKYADFSVEERTAYKRVHEALRQLGQTALTELGGVRDYVLKLTSGFHPASGIRGGKPKDLWFGVYRKENEKSFLGNPQIFMIVSGRGIEYGFSPLTHPDDFSNQEIKQRTREIAKSVLEQLPAPGAPEAKDLGAQLSKAGDWYFRRKQRLDPKQSELKSLDEWLSFMRSDAGVQNAGGGITQYVLADEIDEIDLTEEVRQLAQIFRPTMERIVADAPPTTAPRPPVQIPLRTPGPNAILPAFGDLLRAFLREFAKARSGPFQKTEPLWNAMSDLKGRLEQFPAVQSRPELLINVGVGLGKWAAVPWIALLNTRITQSTQEGVYVVFLIAKELDRIFLTLNQGTSTLVHELGQREAQKRMLDVAIKTRPLISDLTGAGFTLDNKINLGGSGWLAKNYEVGTIAHVDFGVNDIPNDDRMNELLKAALDAYDQAVDAPPPEPLVPGVIEIEPLPSPEPYGMDDALSELFLEQSSLERLLAIWESKKNLILQGAPGVGKSFIAKRVAYLLLEAKDFTRVDTVQFHPSCPRVSPRR